MPLINTIIVWWSGAIVDIPTGWALCNGNNGLPDLRDRFIEGAEGAHAQHATGGSSPHNHPAVPFIHRHDIAFGPDIEQPGPINFQTDFQVQPFTTDNAPNLPKYYALALIGKI